MRYRFAIAGLAAAGLTCVAPAQIRIGGARLTGLAGAGLALPYDAGQVVVNPGLYARSRKMAKFHGPYLDYYAKGLSFGDFSDMYGSIQGGALETENFGTLARKFARNRKEIGVLGSVGATLGGIYIGYRAEGSGSTLPNAELKAWAKESGDPSTLSTTYSGAGLDGYGYAYDAVEFGYGVPFQQPGGTFNVGLRLRDVRAFYTHVIANAAVIQSGGNGTQGPEMGGKDVLKKSGVGIDAGVMFTPQSARNVYLGAVLENAVSPKVGFEQAAPQTNQLKSFNPFATTFNVGAAFVPDKKFMAAADYVDVTNSANRAALRLGAEYMFKKNLGVSAGYNSRETWILGADIYGVYVNISGDQKMWLGRSLRF